MSDSNIRQCIEDCLACFVECERCSSACIDHGSMAACVSRPVVIVRIFATCACHSWRGVPHCIMNSASCAQPLARSVLRNAASMRLTMRAARHAKKRAADAPKPVWPAASPLPAAEISASRKRLALTSALCDRGSPGHFNTSESRFSQDHLRPSPA